MIGLALDLVLGLGLGLLLILGFCLGRGVSLGLGLFLCVGLGPGVGHGLDLGLGLGVGHGLDLGVDLGVGLINKGEIMNIDSKFEEYLMDKHAEQFIGTKDVMVDDFNNWLEQLSIDDWLEYGDKFANKKIAMALKEKA